MNARERFLGTIRFEKLDRPFRWEAPGIWPATIKLWHQQGLPKHITCTNSSDYFGMDRIYWLPFPGGWVGDPYTPMFEEKALADDGEHVTIQDTDGIIKRMKKADPDTSMPQFVKFPVESRDDYETKIRCKLDYTTQERFPANWVELTKEYATREYPIGMFVIGPFGHLRNLMGDDILMYKLYDEPQFIRDIMSHWAAFYQGFICSVCKDVVPDFIMIWEDMCYKSGPLISPQLYRKLLMPRLQDVIAIAKESGIEGIVIDNDGNCLPMMPVYLESGGNAFYPFEVQAGMNIIEIRKEFGNTFTIIGGIDKRTLAVSEEAICAEVDAKVPVTLQQGGFIPMLDHSVPPNVTLKMFEFFLDYVRNVSY